MKTFYLLFLITSMTAALRAQITVSGIGGKALDENNKPIANARVVVTQASTGISIEDKTNENGNYNFSLLDPGGPYKVEIFAEGKKTFASENIYLAVSEKYVVNAVLRSAAAENVKDLGDITVSARRINVAQSGPSITIDKRKIAELSSVQRSILDFTKLSSYASGSGNNFGFAGKDGRYNNYTLDGASLNNSLGLDNNLPGGDAQPISLDAVDQISVLIAPFDVRQSGFTSGSVNVVTKKGGNDFHGGAYTFFRSSSLIGDEVGNQKISIPNSSYYTYGATVGGPIVKNKLFFFLSGEYETKNYPSINLIPSVGAVSQATPTNNISRTTTADLNRLSDSLQTRYGYSTGGYDIGTFSSYNYKALARIDWNINSSNKLMLRFNYVYSSNDELLNGKSAPTPRSPSSRFSKNSYSYKNSNYARNNTVYSIVLDLKSKISSIFSNQLLATYSNNEQKRSAPGSSFPFVDIKNGGDNYISFGSELFSYNNRFSTPTFSIVDNLTALFGNHTLTFGATFEYTHISNSFMPYGTSYYRFSSLEDFFNNAVPEAYALSYAYKGQDPAAKMNFAQLGFYLQDEMALSPSFRLLVGLRVDDPLYLSKLASNDTVSSLDRFKNEGSPYNINLSKWPASSLLLSPRVSFDWTVVPEKLSIKGGVGIFTGKIPFVWYVNQPTNSGTLMNSVTLTGARETSSFRFNPDPNAYVDLFPSNGGATVPSTIVSIDPNFKVPQILRFHIAAAYNIRNNFTIGAEFLYSKDINAVAMYNVNQSPSNGVILDGRQSWWNPDSLNAGVLRQGTRQFYNSVKEAILLTNTDKGGGFSLTVNVKKSFALSPSRSVSHNLSIEASYTYTSYMDAIDLPGSQVTSAYYNTAYPSNLNHLALGNSSYSFPHRAVVYLTYRVGYAKHFSTSVGLSYIGSSTGRFDYTYRNDINGDNISRDLLYVPATRDELLFATPSDRDKFWAFVEQDATLRDNKGKTLERGSGLYPWQHLVNFRLLQDFIFNTNKKVKHTLQFSFEISNLLNLISSSWGVQYALTQNADIPLQLSRVDNSGKPVFQYSGPSEAKTFTPAISTVSAWAMNFGIRYIF